MNNDFENEVTEATNEELPIAEEKAEEPKQAKKGSFLASLVENLEVLVCAACAVIILFTLGVRVCAVNGTSMFDTLKHEDKLLVSNIAYTPERGDIVVFHMTGEDRFNEPLVKRVIATGGEWIDIDFETWVVRVADNENMENAIVVNEPYIYLEGATRYTNLTFPLRVPEGYLFVMGDNRNGSADSRHSKCGLVDERRILGKVICRLYPFEKIENN